MRGMENRRKHTWFYFGGLLPESMTATMKVESGRLFGKNDGDYLEILADDILRVEEFPPSNAFLLVTTKNGKFHVGAKNQKYDEVVEVLRNYVGDDFCKTLTHRCNTILFRKNFRVRSIFKWLIRREKEV